MRLLSSTLKKNNSGEKEPADTLGLEVTCHFVCYGFYLQRATVGVWRNALPSSPSQHLLEKEVLAQLPGVQKVCLLHWECAWDLLVRTSGKILHWSALCWCCWLVEAGAESHRKASEHVQCLPASNLCWWLFSTEKEGNQQLSKQRKGKVHTAPNQVLGLLCFV